ncbi:MAG: MATE family efflux transporter [Pseudomonadota bacterium]
MNRPIGQALRQLAVPAALGMLFNTLFNIVDIFYAGRLGTEALAGLALGYQGFAVLMAFGFGLAAALSALVGKAIGAGDTDLARVLSAQGLAFALGLGVALMLLGWVAGPAVLTFISEPGAYRDAAISYLTVLLLCLPCFVVAYACNGILQAQGDGKSMQRSLCAAAIANVGLNPLFIYGLPGVWSGLGFAGIAASTVLAWVGVLAYMLWRVRTAAMTRTMRRADLRPSAGHIKPIAAQAFPATFSFMILFLSGFIVTYALKGFGGHAVAGYGVAIRLEQILFLPLQGLTLALLPVAAQAYGAGATERMWDALYVCLRIGVLMAVSAAAIIWLLGGPALRLFTSDPEVFRVGLAYLRIDALALPFYTMLFAFTSMFQALQRADIPLWIGLYRRGFGLAIFIWIFIGPLEFNELGVWYAHLVAVLTGWILAVALLWRIAPRG